MTLSLYIIFKTHLGCRQKAFKVNADFTPVPVTVVCIKERFFAFFTDMNGLKGEMAEE